MSNVSICLTKELRESPVNPGAKWLDSDDVLKAIENQLSLDLGRKVTAQMSELALAQPDATITFFDFGNLDPIKARDLMTNAAMVLRKFLPMSGKKILVTMHATLTITM